MWNNADHNALSNLLSTVLDRARARKVHPVRRPQNCPFVASSTPTSTLDPQKPLAAPALVERDLLFPSSRPCDKRTIVTDSCRRFDFSDRERWCMISAITSFWRDQANLQRVSQQGVT